MSTVFGMKSGYNVIFYFHLYNKPRCFWRNLHRWQKFYTPAVSDVSDKFHLCSSLSQCCRSGAWRLFVQFSAGAPLASNHIPRLVTTSTLSNTSFQPSPQWVTSTTPTHHHQLLTSSVCNTCSTLLYLSLCWCWEDQHKEPIDRYKDHLDGQHLTHHTNLAKMRKWQLTILLKKFYRQMRREYCTKK